MKSYKNSKDSLAIKANEYQKKANIADKNLKSVQAIAMSLSDSITNILDKQYQLPDSINNRNLCDFNHLFIHNEQTKIRVIRKDTLMKSYPIISDSLFIYYEQKRRYINEDKNFFKRLFTWDWKKKNTINHKLEHTNDKFKFDDVLFIEIKEDE